MHTVINGVHLPYKVLANPIDMPIALEQHKS